jgi:hypothetical protein
MFKRANKITALLVAAASVMSVVPAMAADSTSRLGTKDGTIENAVAYNGSYVYEGYKSDEDDQAIYYNAGDADKQLDDVEDADLNGAYQDKYAFANDGEDQYLVDLSNGSVIDDQTPEDDADTAATKLKTKLKKTDRYGSYISLDSSNLGYDDSVDNLTATLPGNKFGDSWYAYKVEAASETDADANVVTEADGNKYLYGFADASGKYIDASNLANIYAYSTAKGKMVKIEEFSNSADDVDDDTKLLATLTAQPVVLTQDKDYIYALVKVAITDTSADAVVTGGTTTDAAAYTGVANADGKTTVRTYIQKISKAQGDQKDDAYLPKSVESYEIGNADSEYDCGDAKDAYNAFIDVTGVKPEDVTQDDVVTTVDGKVKAKFTVVNGELIGMNVASDNVQAVSINLKKDKVKFDEGQPGDETGSDNLFDTDDKVDVYFAEKDDDDDVDVDFDSAEDASAAYDFDVDGTPWVIADGKVYKFTNNEMTKVYTTDSSLDSISVYDENNLIAWENDGDIYTTVAEGTKETESEAPATTPAKVGWDQLADGTWNFYDATGTKVVSNWVNVGGVWYYLKADGVMATGWLNDNGTWYYLKSSGAMATGWLNDNGTWYYLNASGAMLANTTVDGYVLGASGAWIQ